MWKWPGPEVRVRASTYWLIAISTLVVVAVLFGDPNRKIAALVSDWQTLIAGMLAIVAAWVSLSGPREQIRQAERFNRDVVEREEHAARSMLPLGLNYITEYARACMTATEFEFQRNGVSGNPIRLPSFDRANLALIRDCVRYAPALYRTRLLAVLNGVQLMEANAVGEISMVPEHALFVRCVEVEYLCDLLFDYGRGRPDTFPPDTVLRAPPDYIRRQAYFRHFDEDIWPELEADLARQEAREARRQAEG